MNKKLCLALSTLVSGLIFGSLSFAGPVEAVTDTATQLISILNISNPGTRASRMCQLVKSRVDVAHLGTDLIGRQYVIKDPAGAAQFQKLVPSVIVSEFFDKLTNVGNAKPVVDPNFIPRGSTRLGVRVNLGGLNLVLTIDKASYRVYDVEYRGVSLVQRKRSQFASDLTYFSARGPAPVADLVNKLINSGALVRCP